MKIVIIVALMLAQCMIAHASDDDDEDAVAPIRSFTNGHGGYQFFHADADLQSLADRRNDNEGHFSDTVRYVVVKPPKLAASESLQLEYTVHHQPEATTPPPPPLASKLVHINRIAAVVVPSSSKPVPSSAENQIGETDTTAKPTFHRMRYTTPSMATMSTTMKKIASTRKRLVVRKFKPSAAQQRQKSPTEKNKKREISASTGNGLHAERAASKYKFTNRRFKPQQKAKKMQMQQHQQQQQATNNRSYLYARKPSEKFVQLHFRKLELSSTTAKPSSMQGMKEKRHLANARFFNRRKIRT